MEGKKVVVIGSGIGGSGVAALLQHRGYDVTVLEKNNFYGGKCHSFERDGFIADCGVHMYSRGPKGPLAQISKTVGGDQKWFVKRKPVLFKAGGDMRLPYCQPLWDPRLLAGLGYGLSMSSLGKAKGALGASPSTKRVKGMANRMYKTLKLGGGISGAFKLAAGMIACNEVLMSDLDEITTRDFVYSFTDNMFWNQFFSYVSMIFTCTTYDRSSAGEIFWCFINQLALAGLGVPEGGSRAIPGDYLRCMDRDGGKLVLGAKVDKIKVDGGRVTGVVAEDGTEYGADIVISNAGIQLTAAMVGEKNLPTNYTKRVNEIEYSYSFITIKYGLPKKTLDFSGAPCYLGIPNLDPETMYDYLKTGEAPEDPHLFVPMQSEWDASVAPAGKQLVIVGVLGPVTATKKDQEHCKKILDRTEDVFESEYPGFSSNAEWTMRTDNNYYAKLTGKHTADCIGMAQIVGQTGIHKPSPKTPVEGLYLVGSDAGARGVGTEQAAASAIAVANVVDSTVSRKASEKVVVA